MSERRPNPAIPADQRCVSCRGWGGQIIHRGGDNYEDSQKCWGCNGSGVNSNEGEKVMSEWETTTPRGFGFTEVLVADYEGQSPRPFTVQQSSLATEYKVWIGVEDQRAHMSIDEARRVRDALNAFLESAWATEGEEEES